MPELPEVETTRRHLAEHLPGARVAAVALLDPRALLRPDPATFTRRLVGATILAVERRAKYLIMPLRRAEPPSLAAPSNRPDFVGAGLVPARGRQAAAPGPDSRPEGR